MKIAKILCLKFSGELKITGEPFLRFSEKTTTNFDAQK